ncbi:MAG: hypothetical protein EHM24_31355 [Acidobacteria bacterium]|nr:MAG: hypothetical protein EHM24_31355 [Acidobacteriota bacterium]
MLVGIDTESDNQWDLSARLQPTFENVRSLHGLDAVFTSHGVRPTYLVTHPVAADAKSAGVLREFADAGACEIGAHHHAWETPPCTPDDARRHLYAMALSAERFDRQLDELTETIERRIGRRPLSYRSGRFGFSAAHVSSLERRGYQVDSSVAPLFSESHKGGPDFAGAPLRPYFLAYYDATVPGSSDLLEIPVSAALNRRLPGWVERAYARAPSPYNTKRILRKLGVARMLWLRPSYCSLEDMTALATRLADDRVPLLNVIFHSSEAMAGGSPYNCTPGDVEAFLNRLGRFFEYAIGKLGAVPATFQEFRARHLGVGVGVAGGG